jgi:ankyrin repeat protein
MHLPFGSSDFPKEVMPSFFSAIHLKHELVIVNLLLTKVPKLESMDVCGKTPLPAAAELGQDAVLGVLIKMSAELHARVNGCTPLSWAPWNGHEATVQLLLEMGAKSFQSLSWHC